MNATTVYVDIQILRDDSARITGPIYASHESGRDPQMVRDMQTTLESHLDKRALDGPKPDEDPTRRTQFKVPHQWPRDWTF